MTYDSLGVREHMNTPLSLVIPDRVRKAQEVVMAKSHGEFTLLDRKVFNVLLARAYKHLSGARIHRISMSDLTALFFEHGRSAPIRETLERLWAEKISIDYIGDDGEKRSVRCHYLSFDLCNIEGGFLEYAFDAILMRFIHNPKVYSVIQLTTVRRFKTNHGLKLYEQMIAYYGRHHPVWSVGLEEAHRFFESGELYRRRFDRFRERVIDQAVREVNLYSEFHVTVDYDTSGRGNRVVGLKFKALPKPDEEIVSASGTSSGKPRRKDGNTVDMFQGASDNDFYAPPSLREDTLSEARRMLGGNGNVHELVQTWNDDFARRGYGADPDETFLAWVRMRIAKVVDPEVADLDVDAIFETIMGDA